MGHKAVLDSGGDQDTAQASYSTVSSANQCSSTVFQSLPLLRTAPILWQQLCGPMWAVREPCSDTGIKFSNANGRS